ncbi:MAG TPA: hypothetical protein VGI78_00505 [Acetobacteraceae bacterium]
MTGLGIIQDDIARFLEIDDKTLRKHFRRELDTGAIEANMRVASSLYTMATQDKNVAAAIWWTKARMGWREQQELNVGSRDSPTHLHLLAAVAISTELAQRQAEPQTIDSEQQPLPANLLDAPTPTE